ncbi:hypothetical protein [Streptomyces sp.]|uniref:hypothetical protein n=1 Tax=Streptomyces sp. TaxID=1931 RepID=UPI002F934961
MSEITPEKVARYLAIGHRGAVGHGGRYVVSGYEGRVVHAEVVEGSERRQFRAVVVEGETVPDLAEASRLKARLDAAEWCMRQALAALEHEEALYLLNRYFAAAEAAQAQTGGAQ